MENDFLHNWIVPPNTLAEPWEYILTAIVALLFTAVSKGGFGGGVGIISVPLMMRVAPTTFVLGLWLPVLIACDIATIRRYPKEWDPRTFLPLTPGMLAGIVLVTVVAGGINMEANPGSPNQKLLEAALRIGTGIISLVFVVFAYRPRREDGGEGWRPTWRVALPAGFAAGVTTMVAHTAGPIVTMFLLPQKMEQRVFVGTCGRFYFIFNTIKIPFMVACGFLSLLSFNYCIWLVLLGPPGVFFGEWLNQRVNAVWFTRLIHLSLLIAAVMLIRDGLKYYVMRNA